MAQIIAANDSNINSQITFVNEVTARLPNSLSKLQSKILKFYAIKRSEGIDRPDYSRAELSIRLGNVHVDYISRTLSELEALGYMASLHGGSRNKKRWITWEGLCVLEGIPSGQMSDQKDPYTNISLIQDPDHEIKELEQPEIVDNKSEPDLNERLNIVLDEQRIPYHQRTTIKNAINRSQLSEESIKALADRIEWIMRNKSIQSKSAYFLKSIQNEERLLND